MKKNLKVIILGVLMTVVAVGVVLALKSKNVSDAIDIQSSLKQDKSKGSSVSPIRIVEFSDFQCPACKSAIPVLEDFNEKYPGKIQITFKHFPLRSHKHAKISHQAAECANRQGYFWDFHDLLYEKQMEWGTSQVAVPFIVKYAQQVNLNMEEFEKCMVDEKVSAEIFAEKAEGVDLEVKSTPTFFLNGERLAGSVELRERGEKMIREILGIND